MRRPGGRAVDGDDEIAAVAASFNAAADRADALLGAHKALLAHASHELRSPLTRLRLAVEMLAAGPVGDLGPVRSVATSPSSTPWSGKSCWPADWTMAMTPGLR